MIRGLVVGVNRADRLVQWVDPDGVGGMATYMGDPPWPLSTCLFDNGPAWVCMGPLGDRRLVMHEDFMWHAASGLTLSADNPWLTAGTGSVASVNDPGEGCAGVIAVSAASGQRHRIRRLDRAISVPADQALWLRARVSGNANLVTSGSGVAYVGLANNEAIDGDGPAANDSAVLAFIETNMAWQYSSFRGTSTTDAQSGEPVTAAAYTWVDIMVVSGSWAAFWFDGSGPYVTDTNVPQVGDEGVTPFVDIVGFTGTSTLNVDLMVTEMVFPVQHPADVARDAVYSVSY